MNPLVSVIIITYNSAKYITEAAESVLTQTYNPVEVIVVDDGSTDNTRDILKPNMDRIKYIYKENGGCASARNAGIDNAKGEYVAFLDADDAWLPNKLDAQSQVFKEDPEVMLVYSNALVFYENTGFQEIFFEKFKNTYSGYIFEYLLLTNFIATSTVVVKKKAFELLGKFTQSKYIGFSDDYEMWLRIAKKFKIGRVNEVLAKYRKHNNNLTRNLIDGCYFSLNSIKKNINSDCRLSKEFIIPFKKRIARIYFKLGYLLYEDSKIYEAQSNLAKSILYYPFAIRKYILLLAAFLFPRLPDNIKRKLILGLNKGD